MPQAPALPLRIEPAYRDRDAVWSLVQRHGPYRLMAGLAGYGAIPGHTPMPWFREHWALDGQPLVDGVEPLLHNHLMLDAARKMFGAEVVRPSTLLVNLMGPMAEGVPHIDTPSFRGLPRGSVPVWLLIVMGASGLFDRWQLRVAGAVTWFYDRADGEFEYWPHNAEGPPQVEAGPFGNVALITDSDRMFHRVRRIGAPGDALADACFKASAVLHFDGGLDARSRRRPDPDRRCEVAGRQGGTDAPADHALGRETSRVNRAVRLTKAVSPGKGCGGGGIQHRLGAQGIAIERSGRLPSRS